MILTFADITDNLKKCLVKKITSEHLFCSMHCANNIRNSKNNMWSLPSEAHVLVVALIRKQ
jgi:hypothetical protein